MTYLAPTAVLALVSSAAVLAYLASTTVLTPALTAAVLTDPTPTACFAGILSDAVETYLGTLRALAGLAFVPTILTVPARFPY